jgi:hypothetical protein
MARVWFVRRQGGQWIAPGGAPAFEMPLPALVFPLDLGVHRTVSNERPLPEPELAPEDPSALQRVFVEVDATDLDGLIFTGYQPGYYDSPYGPSEAARRLARVRPATRTAA